MMIDENDGFFRIISDTDSHGVLGTAFAIKTFEVGNVYYLLTAYHVIAELYAKNEPIIVEDENGRCHSAIIVFPDYHSINFREFGQDYALLKMYSDVQYRTVEIAIVDSRSDCFVRGAISHYCTIFTSIDGKILGEESILGQEKKVLQIQLKNNTVFDTQSKYKPDQQVLRGLSGAPVLVEMEGENVCVGVIGNLERDYCGSLKYAVSMKCIIGDCLSQLNISYKLFNERTGDNISYSLDALVELVIGDTSDFLFADEQLEQEAWNKLSNLFYKGIFIDISLGKILQTQAFERYNAEVKCTLMYFYARIMLKRGKNKVAFETFERILKILSGVSGVTKVKLNTLICSRYAIEKKISRPKETLNAIRQAGDKIIYLPNASEDYVSYELSSMYGRGLTNLFSLNIDFSSQEKEDIIKIFSEHKNLLNSHPIKLCKQDVVNTSLQWYLCYWGIYKDSTPEVEYSVVCKGFIQSKQRKNSIFYIQSMISYGIFSAYNDRIVQAIKLLLLSAKLLHKERVQLDHEGIKQLLLILKEKYIALYTIFTLAYLAISDEQFLSKVDLFKIDLGVQSFGNILRCVNECYAIKFYDERIYNIDMDDIEMLL